MYDYDVDFFITVDVIIIQTGDKHHKQHYQYDLH